MKIWVGKEVDHKISLFDLYEEAHIHLLQLMRVMKCDPLIVIAEAIDALYEETFSNGNKESLKELHVKEIPEAPVEPSVEPSSEASIEA